MQGGVLVVNAIDLGGLHHHIGTNLGGPQGSGGVGGEEGVAAAGAKDHNPPLLQVADCLPADVGLGHLLHADGALDPGGNPGPLQAVLEGDRIHHRGEHAHVVGRGPVHAGGRALEAAEDVAAAHHDRQFGARGHHGGHITGDRLDDRRVNAVALISHQRFAAELEQDTPVAHRVPGEAVGRTVASVWDVARSALGPLGAGGLG